MAAKILTKMFSNFFSFSLFVIVRYCVKSGLNATICRSTVSKRKSYQIFQFGILIEAAVYLRATTRLDKNLLDYRFSESELLSLHESAVNRMSLCTPYDSRSVCHSRWGFFWSYAAKKFYLVRVLSQPTQTLQ